MFANIGVFQM